jgi:hypothetical protein
MSALTVFGGRSASVMVVVEESVSVTCSCGDGGSEMGVTGSMVSGKDAGIRRGRRARVRFRMARVSELLGWAGFAMSSTPDVA